jgi:alpha-tubulin suppressor-like RCC1 family protein
MRTTRFLLVLLLALGLAPTRAEAAEPEGFLAGIAQIDAGDGHTCARLTDGTARCWGDNFEGQLADTTTDDRHLPTVVLREDGLAPLIGIAQIDAGFHTCARLTNGQARCWGSNWEGELGDGTTEERHLPVVVTVPGGTALTGVAQISASDTFTCARLTNRQVRCWGRNEYGQLGDGTEVPHPRARLVRLANGKPLADVVQLTTGRDQVCALLRSSKVRCWGDNDAGQLGIGTTGGERRRPQVMRNMAGNGPLLGVAQVVAGDDVTCVRLRTQEVRCTGDNEFGSLGNGGPTDRSLPVAVKAPDGTANLDGVLTLSTAGGAHVCARIAGGQVLCWGRNADGGLGNGTEDDAPLPVSVLDPTGTIPLGSVAQVSAGSVFTCARLTNGQGRCWGDNGHGQLGDGTQGTDRLLPVVVQL